MAFSPLRLNTAATFPYNQLGNFAGIDNPYLLSENLAGQFMGFDYDDEDDKEDEPKEKLNPFQEFIMRSYEDAKDEKAYYHALCVMSGNFTTIIWSKLFKELESRLNIPKEAAFTYLNSIALNLQINHRDALTGPLIRGDSKTINQNLAALENDSFLPIYQIFIKILGENYGHK